MVVIKYKVRADIITVASKVFSRSGYSHTSMNDIARDCNMGKSSLYYYYKGKEEIFEAVVVKEAQELKKQLNKVSSSVSNPMMALKEYILFRLYHVKTVSNFYTVIKDEHFKQMKFVERVRKKFEDEEYKMVYDILDRGIKEETFVLESPEIGAMAFTTMLKGLELPLFLNKYTRQQKEKLLDDLIRVVFFGLIKR